MSHLIYLNNSSPTHPTSVYSEVDCGTPFEVPTLHVLFSRPVEPALIPNPAIHHTVGKAAITETREELISWIADEALGGDRDAAEWILLITIARVYVIHASNLS